MKRLIPLALVGLAACTQPTTVNVSSQPDVPYTQFIRLTCYTAGGTVGGILPREEFVKRVRIVNAPCIVEGIDTLPVPNPTSSFSPTTKEKTK